MWSQRLQSERDGGVGTLGAEMELKLTATMSRTGEASSWRFHLQIRMQSRTTPSSTCFSSLPSANLREGT